MDRNLNSIRYAIPNAEDLCQCPYDDTHMIRAKRMPFHLTKCRQNHKGLNYMTCPFNARHEMRAPELRYHIMNCPDRVMVQQDITASTRSGGHKGNLALPLSNWEPIQSNEDWEEDAPKYPVFGVDKSTWMKKKIMSKSTIGMTRAERKKFYEILRVNYHREQEGLEPIELNLQDDDPDAMLQELLQKQILSLRKPLNKPQVLLAAEQRNKKQLQEPTPIHNQSLLLAGIGRGKAVNRPEVDLPKPGMGKSGWNRLAASIYSNGSSRSDTVSGTTASDMFGSSVAPPLRGIGRGMPGIGRGLIPPGLLSPARTKTGSDVASLTAKDGDAKQTGAVVIEPDFEFIEGRDCEKKVNTDDDDDDDDEVDEDDGDDDDDEVDEYDGDDDVNKLNRVNKLHGNDDCLERKEDLKKDNRSSFKEDEISKRIKKCEKKLRGIEVLEDRTKEGAKLNPRRLRKYQGKEELSAYLEELKLQQ